MCRNSGFCPICSISFPTSSTTIMEPLVPLPPLPGLSPIVPEPPIPSGNVDMSRGRGKDPSPRKDPRKGSDQRQKSGARERNLGHKNAEEHSRVPKGNGMPIRRMVAIGSVAVLSVAIIVLAADDVTGVGIADDALIPQTVVLWAIALQTALA